MSQAKKKTVDLSVVNRIVVVVPRFTQWTGTRAMHEGDFSIGVNGRMPPKEVTRSLGLKAIIDTQELRVFDRIKHRAEATLESCGVRYLSGWAIPEDKSSEVFKELDMLVQRYNEEKASFLSRYDNLVADWAQKNPAFYREILDGKLDENAVAERITAGYETFRLQPISPEKAVTLAKSIGGLSAELISSVSKSAKSFFKESFLGKTKANRKTVNAVLRIRDRLRGLSFLSATLLPLISMIDEVVAQMPIEGYFSGEPFWKLATLVKTLGDQTLLEEIIRQKTSIEDEFPAVGNPAEETLDLGGNTPDLTASETVAKQPQEQSLFTFDDDIGLTELENCPQTRAVTEFSPGRDFASEVTDFDHPEEDDIFSSLNAPSKDEVKLAQAILRQVPDDGKKIDEHLTAESATPKASCDLPTTTDTVARHQPAFTLPEIDIGEGLYF